PVDSVSWDDCQAFCRTLSALEGRKYRPPTEAQWEYACRAGTTTPFWWGDTITTDQANYNGDPYGGGGKKGEYRGKPTPVDFFKPNPWGLYDMHGNLWQWCEDWYGEDSRPDARAGRGGCWNFNPDWCRAARRGRDAP